MKFVSQALDNCPCGWNGYGNSCYQFVHQLGGVNWESARRRCLGSGGDLVSITDQSEMSFVSNKSINAWNQHYWIGLNDRRNESQFVWSDGTPYNVSVYSNWHQGEPSDRSGEDCVELYRTRWNDNGCKEEFGYICEKLNGNSMYHSQCGIVDLSTVVPCRCCRLKCILGQNDFKVSLQGNESRTVVGLFEKRNICRFEATTWGSGVLRDLTAKTFVLRRVQSLEYENLY